MATPDGFIAWIDLLGFKGWIQTRPTEEIARLMESSLPRATYLARHVAQVEPGTQELRQTTERCQAVQFQDTVVLWSGDRSIEAFEGIVAACLDLALLCATNSIPFRGGLARGELYLSENPILCIGRGLLAAHEQEGRLSMVGIAVDPAVFADWEIRDYYEWQRANTGRICDYPIGAPAGTPTVCCIGWPQRLGPFEAEEVVERLFSTTPLPAAVRQRERAEGIRAGTLDFVARWRARYRAGLPGF